MSLPRRSRDGLTRCPACRAHIVAAERPSETVCPFCGANQHRTRIRLAPVGRGGILAASLLAFGAMGCGGGGTSDGDTSVSSDDGTTGGDDGTGGDDQYDDQPPDDSRAVAEYGIAPDEYERESPDPPPDEPMYGVPPEDE